MVTGLISQAIQPQKNEVCYWNYCLFSKNKRLKPDQKII
jgi:hypothetical protein